MLIVAITLSLLFFFPSKRKLFLETKNGKVLLIVSLLFLRNFHRFEKNLQPKYRTAYVIRKKQVCPEEVSTFKETPFAIHADIIIFSTIQSDQILIFWLLRKIFKQNKGPPILRLFYKRIVGFLLIAFAKKNHTCY